MTKRVIINEGNTRGNVKGGVNKPSHGETQNVKPSKPPPAPKPKEK